MTRGVMDEIIAKQYPNCDELGGVDDDPETTGIEAKWFPFGRRIVGCSDRPIIIVFEPRVSAALVSSPASDEGESSDGENTESDRGFWDDLFYIPKAQVPGQSDPNPEGAGIFR